MAKSRVGFLGLGSMGKPMAKRLLTHGWDVVSCAHVHRQALEELKTLGLIEVASPQAVAAQTDIVITMVRDTQASQEVILGAQGALQSMPRNATLIIMSTLDPTFCQRVASHASTQGVAVLDAPVSGLPFRAEQGTLAIMVGGESPVLEQYRPLLQTFGQIFPCGAVGMGMVAKLANNAVAVGTAALLLEAQALARAYGMPIAHLMEIFTQASADSFMVQHWEAIGAMWEHVIGLGLKDLGIGLEAAQHQGVSMPLISATLQHEWRRLP